MSEVPDMLADRVTLDDSGCWHWQGAKDRVGYGRWSALGRKSQLAHRVVFLHMVGDIPAGTELDHLCRNPSCVNPAHLEAVGHRENVRRGSAGVVNAARMLARTHCKWGHEYSPENTYVNSRGHRNCRICMRRSAAGRRSRNAR